MTITVRVSGALITGAVVLMAAVPSWKDKPTADWSEEDARQILLDSPWAKSVKVPIGGLQTEDQRREGGNMGQPHGVGFDGFNDDRPRAEMPTGLLDIAKPEQELPASRPSIVLQLRWESALPIRVAELKARIVEVPDVWNDCYTLAVYGVPDARFKSDAKSLADPLRKQAVLKREGKKDVRPSSVEVDQRDDGLVIIYAFPMSAEIGKNDRRIEFDAHIGRLSVAQSFDVEDMLFQGKLEL